MFGRDATRNAVSPEKKPPLQWSVEKGKEKNIAWKSHLGGLCFTPPVVEGGLVWIGTNNEFPRDPSLKGDASILMCFREADGEFLWQHASPWKKELYDHGEWGGLPLRCSPLVEGDRLWFINNRWEVISLDIGPLKRGAGEPRERWRTDLMSQTGSWPMVLGMGYGLTCSIGASYSGLIYLSTSNGIRWKTQKMETPDAPALVCLDKDSGVIRG